MESKIIKFGDNAENQININTEKVDYINLLPKEAESLVEMILVLGQTKTKDAQRGIDMLLLQFPKNLEVKAFAALSYYYNGKKQKALALIEENYAQDPEHILTRCTLARIEIMSNNPAAVSKIFNNDFRVIIPNKDRTIYLAEFYELLYTFGLFFGAIGHKENALAYTANFKSASHPEHPYLLELMDMCCKKFGHCMHKEDGENTQEDDEQTAQETSVENKATCIDVQAHQEINI